MILIPLGTDTHSLVTGNLTPLNSTKCKSYVILIVFVCLCLAGLYQLALAPYVSHRIEASITVIQ